MSVSNLNVKKNHTPGVGAAPLRNMTILYEAVEKSRNRSLHLPGMVTFSGHSGWGKSTAAGWVAAQMGAYHVEMRSVWAKKPFLSAVLKTMGITPTRTVADMMDQVSEELAASQRPLIIDEFDYAVQKDGMTDMIRDIYEQSNATIVLIGEENLPHKLKKWERFDGRIVSWAQALPADLDDARELNEHYSPKVEIADDLLADLVNQSHGSVRRIVVNIDRITDFARMEGLKTISKKEWGSRQLYTAVPPKTRGL